MTAPLTEEARQAAELQAWARRAYQFEVLILTLGAEAIRKLEAHDPAEGRRLWRDTQERLTQIRSCPLTCDYRIEGDHCEVRAHE
jgi:hypothetical protein